VIDLSESCAFDNQVILNEEIDPNLVIRRLKQEIVDMKVGPSL
jgi:hypothetical protein